MPQALALVLALLALAGTLAAAVARTRWPAETVVASGAAALLVALGALSPSGARHAIEDLGPTVGFLAALLVLAEGCRREGLFEAMGGLMAAGSRGRPRRLLAMVFAIATGVTAVLSLDATVVLLTPIVFATAARLRTSPKPHVYACSHLANSASLLLPVSNLTNLLAFHASGLSFTRFASLMALPTAAAVAVEWLVLSRFFAVDLRRPRRTTSMDAREAPPLPRVALGIVALTLAGFAASSLVGIAPVWVAVAGAAAITLPALARRTTSPRRVLFAAEPSFLVFVLGLGVIVRAAADNGLDSAVQVLLPSGHALPALLGVAAVSAILANVVNNLPATLMLVPVAAAAGPGPVLAVLVGVNVGPNLTYVGSLATLLWRRVLHVEDTDVELAEFVRLGALTVPAAIVAATLLLWFSLEVIG
ncbi:MAG TPA: SLC13 family permease [Solirubrobacteraceae bacterium]